MKRQSKKLKGTVLFTVVSVMSLLIIFLMGTLVLAASANNRAHRNYSSSQTEYTSRTAIDSVIKAISADESFADAICNVSSTSGTLSIPVEIEGNFSSMGKIDDVTVEYCGTKSYYDEDTNVWKDRDLLKLTASVTLGGQTSTTSTYLVKDPPTPSGGGGGGAGFVTTGGASLENHSNVFGGSYLNIPSLSEAQTYNYQSYTKNYLSGRDFTLGNGQVVETDFVVNGNFSLSQSGKFVIPYEGTGLTIWGNLTFSTLDGNIITSKNCTNSQTYNFNKIPYIYVDGQISANKVTIGDGSFPLNIFCGTVNANGNGFNVTADIYCMDTYDTTVAGFDASNLPSSPTATSVISTNSTNLSSWSASVINKSSNQNGNYVAGNIFSKGNLQLGGGTINGDVRAEGDVTITGNLTIKGDLVVGGTLTKTGNLNVTGNIYAKNAVGFTVGTELQAGVIKVENTYHPSEVKVKSGYTKVDNAFYEYTYVSFEFVEQRNWQNIYRDLDGNETTHSGAYYDINNKVYYNEWELQTVTLENGTTKRGYFAMLDADGNHLTKEQVQTMPTPNFWNWNNMINSVSNGQYVLTDKYAYIYDGMGKAIDPGSTWEYTETVPAYYTVCDVNGADTGVTTSEQYSYYKQLSDTTYQAISASEAYNAEGVLPITDYTQSIYPVYAEKDVILGLRQIADGSSGALLDTSETQVVMTMEDILNNVVNPYQYTGIPSMFQTTVNSLRASGSIINNVSELRSYMGTVATSLYDASGKVNIQYKTYDSSTDQKSYPVINQTCILNIGGIDASYFLDGERAVVIDPGSSEICVVIDNLSLASGTQIIIDDSQGGTVHLYVNGSLSFDEQLITTSYLQLQKDKTPFQIYTNSACKMGGIAEIDPPKVYIYGATGSSIHVQNMKGITAFVLAPETSFSFGNASSSFWDNSQVIYYNGYQVSGAGVTDSNLKCLSVIGCLNVSEANLGNNNITLYLPDTGTSTTISTPSANHWFKILYYDEY